MRSFLIIFSLSAIAIFVFHFQATVYATLTQPWTELLAKISASLIHLFDDDVTSAGVQILTDPSQNSQNFAGVEIVAGCNGIEAWLVLVAAIMAFPPYSYLRFRWVVLGVIVIMLFPLGWDAWFGKSLIAFAFVLLTQFYCPIGWQKLWGLVIGFIAIQALNVVRVISLFYLGQWDKGLFDFAHYYAWQALIILDALVVFLIWLSKLPNENPPSDQPPNNRQPADNASTAAIQQS